MNGECSLRIGRVETQPMPKSKKTKSRNSGKLKIGDDWNAITIIALSQSSPLKAVAEFVENSIDAKARHVTITRGKKSGKPYLRILDDGEGIRRNGDGAPDFLYVATHICDSIKRQLRVNGTEGLQGEYGIGLLSFWTVGEEMVLTSSGDDGRTYRMHMKKGDPDYSISRKSVLFPDQGTEIFISPILPGIKQLSGEKIQWYLASELRDRIKTSGVEIRVIDRTARSEFKVEPKAFEGQRLHTLPKVLDSKSELYLEIYLNKHQPENTISLYRRGTRVLSDISELEAFKGRAWTSGYLQGLIDAPYLELTPGTRLGVIQDENFQRLIDELAPVAEQLEELVDAQQKAEEEKTSRDVLRSIQKALKEALMTLPAEEYDWFDISRSRNQPSGSKGRKTTDGDPKDPEEDGKIGEVEVPSVSDDAEEPDQKQFFEYEGPLFSAKISPQSAVIRVGESRNFGAIARDRTRHRVEKNLKFEWSVIEGGGRLENPSQEIVTFHAPEQPELIRLKLVVRQNDIVCEAEALVTVTDSILPQTSGRPEVSQGIPGYTFQKAPGELWRSRFDTDQNVVVINNGHRDFVYSSKSKVLKLRYICRLFAKELVLKNFVGISPDQLLERMVELTLYTETNLK